MVIRRGYLFYNRRWTHVTVVVGGVGPFLHIRLLLPPHTLGTHVVVEGRREGLLDLDT